MALIIWLPGRAVSFYTLVPFNKVGPFPSSIVHAKHLIISHPRIISWILCVLFQCVGIKKWSTQRNWYLIIYIVGRLFDYAAKHCSRACCREYTANTPSSTVSPNMTIMPSPMLGNLCIRISCARYHLVTNLFTKHFQCWGSTLCSLLPIQGQSLPLNWSSMTNTCPYV